MQIPFNKPYLTGKETEYIREAVASGKISGDGHFTQKCHSFFEQRYGFKKCLLTTSCTAALEMAAILLDMQPGDEVIAPSYTFVSSVNAFVLRGAKIVFADSEAHSPNIDADSLEGLITPRTKALVVVHYAGMACDMDKVMALAKKYNLFVVEDAAQAIDSYYKGRPLGSIGHLAAFSFHETKNIIAGEGGMLVINDERFMERAEIIWEKGTNRRAFFRQEVSRYEWLDIGSSFLPSEITAAFLYAQLECLEQIQTRRKSLWGGYQQAFLQNQAIQIIQNLPYTIGNAHMFFLLCQSTHTREALRQYLLDKGILAISHYLPLHASPYYASRHDGRPLPQATAYAERLLRLPIFYDLRYYAHKFICSDTSDFFTSC